jgi:hypothetical protein
MEADKPLRHGRLGASIIRRPCERFLWYSFRKLFSKAFGGRMLRLFETGHLEEPRLIRELRGIGCTVLDKDEDTGQQFEFTALGGHFVCYPDAAILGVPEAPKTWHVGEFKTMGGEETQSKDFEKVKAEGVKKAKPEHYAQMQMGMGLSGMTRALYLCKKKATDELHSERVRYDAGEFQRMMDRARRVIEATNPLERCAKRPDDFRCKWCDAFPLCWGTGETAVPIPKKTCRSCCHATPEIDADETWARWSCAKHGCDLDPADQQTACPHHLLLPGLVTFAEAVDSGPDWIEFKNTSDGAVWRHGNGEGMWTTEELMRTPGPLVGEKSVQAVKEAFNGTVTAVESPLDDKELTLLERYPPEDSRLLWEGEPTGENLIVAFNEVRKALDLDSGAALEPSSEEDTNEHEAVEFGSVLYVNYKSHNYAAVWQGVE